jgi:hypothetical protein
LIHVQCQNCQAFDIAGPGHPAVECAHPAGTGCDAEGAQHVLVSREKLRHSHADGCQPDEDGNYPLAFTFMAGTAPVSLTGA